MPLLAGLNEIMPWVKQWHGEVDPVFGVSPADAYAAYLEGQLIDCGVSVETLKQWRPPKPTRGGGRRRKKES